MDKEEIPTVNGQRAAEKIRVLVLDEELPLPANTGKRIRTLNLLTRLATDFDIDLLVHGNGASPHAIRELAEMGIDIHVAKSSIPSKRGPGFYGRVLGSLASKYPYAVWSHWQAGYVEELDELLRRKHYDLIHCEWTPYAQYVLRHTGKKWTVAAHNVESMVWQRMAKYSEQPKRWFLRIQANRMRRFEESVFERCSAVIAVSEPDAIEITKLGASNTSVVHNGVDTRVFRPSTSDQRIRRTLVFTASFDWRPNQDGARWFLDEVHPKLIARSGFRVKLVGRNPPAWLIKRCQGMQDVEVTGEVADVAPFLLEGEIAIVPLRFGGGSRLKILEAFSSGIPVVSTTMGAEGLSVQDGVHIMLADSPGEFADKILQLSGDADLRRALAKAGRVLVEERYDWGMLAKKQGEVWREVVHESAGPSEADPPVSGAR